MKPQPAGPKTLTPQEFIAKWQRANLTERSACQQHFLDLCDLLGQPKPAAADPDGAWYTFEQGGRTVVAWERKGHMCVVSAAGLDSGPLVELITR